MNRTAFDKANLSQNSFYSEHLQKTNANVVPDKFAEQLLKREETQPQKPLSGRVEKALVAASSQEKTRGIAGRLLLWTTNTGIAVWGTKHCLKLARFFMTLGTPSEGSRSLIDQEINKFCGSYNPALAIHKLTPLLAKWVQKELVALDWHKSVNAFLKEEHWTLQTLLDVLLTTMYANISKSLKEGTANQAILDRPVEVADILGCLCKIAHEHLPSINARYDVIEKIPDLEKRERKLRQLFGPMVEDFLAIAFPKGIKEFPLTKVPWVSNSFWMNVHKHLLPSLFLGIYRQLSNPLKEEKKQKLLQIPGGESLVSLAEIAGQKGGETIPSLFMNSDEKNTFSPLVTSIMDGFRSCLEASDKFREVLGNWLGKQLSHFGSSDDSNVKRLWMFIGGYLEPVFLHVFFHMSAVPQNIAAMNGRTPDALGIIAIRFFSLFSHFFNANKKMIDERVAALNLMLEDPEEDDVLLSLFRILADDMLEMMGLSTAEQMPLPNFIKNTAFKNLKEALPKFLLKQYFAITNSEMDDISIRKKLRSLMLDPKNLRKSEVTTKVISELHKKGIPRSDKNMIEEFYQTLWKESGTEKIVETMEEMCSVLANDLVEAAMGHYGVASQKMLSEKNNQFMKETHVFFKRLSERVLLEILVHLVETTIEKIPAGENQHPKHLLIFHTIMRFCHLLKEGLASIDVKLANANQSHQQKHAYLQDIRRAFAPLAAEFHALGGKNPLASLPLEGFPAADNMKELLWIAIRDTLLPDFLYQTYSEITDWQQDIQKSLNILEHCYHTTHPRWASHVLAQYVSDFVKHYLTTSSDDAAKTLLASLRQYFLKSVDESGRKVETSLQLQSASLETLMSQNLHLIGASEEAELNQIWPALTRYIEAAIAKFLAGISKTIHDIEAENPDFMIDVAITMLKDTAEHFDVLNRVTTSTGEEHSYRVDSSIMLAAFGSLLHDGVPLDPKATDSEKEQARLQGYFIPLAAKLLDLANLNINDFPLPIAFKQQLGELMIQNLLPLALMRADEKVLEHHVRDALMLNFVQTLYAALNGIEPAQEEGLPEESEIKLDPQQKRLNETCGALVLALVKLIPDTMVQYVFMKEKVKDMSAEAIGEAMMPHLSKWTLLQLIDTALYYGLPSFHPAKWEGKVGREVLIPRKAFIRPDGKMELKPVKKFKFTFPQTPAEITAANEAVINEAQKTRMKLRDGFTKTISSQLRVKAWIFTKTLWETFQANLNDFIEGQFPDKGPKVKAVVDTIVHWLFFDLLGSLFQFLATPFIRAVQYIIEKVYIDKRSEDIIENLHSDALENLFYKWLDTVLDMLVGFKKPLPERH